MVIPGVRTSRTESVSHDGRNLEASPKLAGVPSHIVATIAGTQHNRSMMRPAQREVQYTAALGPSLMFPDRTSWRAVGRGVESSFDPDITERGCAGRQRPVEERRTVPTRRRKPCEKR